MEACISILRLLAGFFFFVFFGFAFAEQEENCAKKLIVSASTLDSVAQLSPGAGRPRVDLVNEWLLEISGRWREAPEDFRYIELPMNAYGRAWDHHHFVLYYSADQLAHKKLRFNNGLMGFSIF